MNQKAPNSFSSPVVSSRHSVKASLPPPLYLLENRGLKVSMLKLDPYINVDPGTMSPFQHGEVYVLDDGAETDLDLGHYERFTSQSSQEARTIPQAVSIKASSTKSGARVPRRYRSGHPSYYQ